MCALAHLIHRQAEREWRSSRDGRKRIVRCVYFSAGMWCLGAGAGGFGTGLAGRWRPRGLRCSGHQPGRDVADEASIWASSSESYPNPGSGFDDAGAELQKAQSEGGKLGGGERVRFGDCVSDGEDQPIRGGMQDQAHLVGERAAAAGTIRGELSLVQLDQSLPRRKPGFSAWPRAQ